MSIGGARMITSAERLRRLLALVPYVASRKVVSLKDTAEMFGISERDLIDDLNLAWCMELGGSQPYCPIDLSYEGGEIMIGHAEALDRPLPLAVDEASALLVALQMLADVGGGDEDVIDAVRDKLRAVAGSGAVPAGSRVAFVPVEDVKDKVAGLRDALSRGRRVHLRYYVPSRDEATERDVDPMQLLVADGRAYLEGWCRRAGDVRLFRLDRVLDLTVLDVPADVPQEAHQQARDVDAGLFRASPDDALVVLQVSAVARWVAEYYPTESAVPITDGPFAGGLLVTLRASDTGWLRRLALRLGENARVLSPPELAASIRSTASAALANYDQ